MIPGLPTATSLYLATPTIVAEEYMIGSECQAFSFGPSLKGLSVIVSHSQWPLPTIRQLLLYFGLMALLVNLVNPGFLLDIPTSYMLKNILRAPASQISEFRLLTGIPFYLGFVFGMARDLWSPFGRRDPGYFLLFVPVLALVLGWMGLSRTTYTGLLIGMLAAMISFSFLFAAFQGLMALIGQEALMSGRMSALSNIFLFLPIGAAYFASGFMTEYLTPRQIFLMVLVLTSTLSVFGFWKPRSVFSHTYDNPHAKGTHFLGDLKRLLQHRAIYPVVLINLLWNFTPGSYTPMQFFLTNQLHASDAIYADFTGLYNVFFLPPVLLYGFLCTTGAQVCLAERPDKHHPEGTYR
jgi:hypothetical protein